MMFKQRIIVSAEMFWDSQPLDRFVDHTTQLDAIDIGRLNAKVDEASGQLIHNTDFPMSLKCN